MSDGNWHQHGGGPRPAIPAERLIEVWDIGERDAYIEEAAAIDWRMPLRWRLLPMVSEATSSAPTAVDLLTRAAGLLSDRGRQYDKPEGERSMARTVQAFNAITGRDLTEAEGWLLLQVLKDVRQWQRPGYHADSAEDCVAYAALKGEALARGNNE